MPLAADMHGCVHGWVYDKESATKERACNTCGNENERANVRWRDGKYAHVRTSEGADSRCVKKR